jgi:ABC-type phosphate transport system substrate-binding protein
MLFTGITHAGVSVIVHPSNTSTFSIEDIKAIYLAKTKAFPNGEICIPINLAKSNTTRLNFESTIIGKSKSQMKAYWSRLVFTGKAQYPKEVMSDEDVIKLVSNNPSIIGFVASGSETANVKVVYSQ